MKKGISISKLNRTPSHRKAMLRNMATSLLEHERIITTREKGKVLRKYIEPLITMARKNILEDDKSNVIEVLNCRRILNRHLRGTKIVDKLLKEIAVRYKERPGGYLRIIHLQDRKSDASRMSIVELLDRKEKVKRLPQAIKGNTQKIKTPEESDKLDLKPDMVKKKKEKWYNRLGSKTQERN